MRTADLLKIKWLLLNINKLEKEDRFQVLDVCEKSYHNVAQVPVQCWDLIDRIYQKLRLFVKSNKSGVIA